MNKDLAPLRMLVAVSGRIAKQEILTKYKDNAGFRRVLYYALNPMLTYKVSEDTLRSALPDVKTTGFSDIYEILDTLSAMKAVDGNTLASVAGFLNAVPYADREIYIKLLSKKLRLGVSAKTVNTVIPGLIPEWEVQQAFPIDSYPLKPGVWFSLTQKLNGVRATYYRGRLYARSGNPYDGMEHVTDVIEKAVSMYGLPPETFVFDGELTLADKGSLSDNEAFRVATGVMNADDADKSVICYTIFDMLPADEFDAGQSKLPYGERRTELSSFAQRLSEIGGNLPVRVLPVLYSGTDQDMIPKLLDQMVREDKEGLMVNLNVPYMRKRHSGILKVKRFYTMDLPVIGYEEGSGRLSGKLGALVLDFKGNPVRVGSGFTDDERSAFWSYRDDLSEYLCEVKYKDISSDKKTGKQSLQFPIFVRLRTDKNSVSYG